MVKIISQKDLFPNLIKLDTLGVDIKYPVGSSMTFLLDYCESAASKLTQIFPMDNIAFIVRGTSGVMIGGIVASLLMDKAHICSKVIINRKTNEDCHASNLEGLKSVLNYEEINPFRLVVIDDFIGTGKTIYNIVNDVESYIGGPFIFDALVINNKFIYKEYMGDKGTPGDLILAEEGTIAEKILLTKFLNILCS